MTLQLLPPWREHTSHGALAQGLWPFWKGKAGLGPNKWLGWVQTSLSWDDRPAVQAHLVNWEVLTPKEEIS